MSDTPASKSEPESNKLNLDKLIPGKQLVETSIGPLFIRHARASDLESLERQEPEDMGSTVVRQFCSRIEDKHDATPLPDDDLAALTEADHSKLAPAIASQSNWEGLPAGAGLAELGDVAKAAFAADRAHFEKINAELSASLKSKYNFLNESLLGKLQGQMADLTKLSAFGSSLAPPNRQALGLEKLINAAAGIKVPPLLADISPPAARSLPLIPRPEETVLGRATLESAKHSKESSAKIEALVQVVAGLNQTVVADILPAWSKKFESDQAAGKESFEQAARSLRWTRWAVYSSIAVTAFATAWQVWVAYAIDEGNAIQQKRVEDALREQLAVQRTMIEQQAREAALLRETIQGLKPLVQSDESKRTRDQRAK